MCVHVHGVVACVWSLCVMCVVRVCVGYVYVWMCGVCMHVCMGVGGLCMVYVW